MVPTMPIPVYYKLYLKWIRLEDRDAPTSAKPVEGWQMVPNLFIKHFNSNPWYLVLKIVVNYFSYISWTYFSNFNPSKLHICKQYIIPTLLHKLKINILFFSQTLYGLKMGCDIVLSCICYILENDDKEWWTPTDNYAHRCVWQSIYHW